MTSRTTTQFKQKTCPKCKNNHDNEGVLCSFCIQAADAARKKVQQPPADFWVKCLIEREGNTTLNLGNIQYTFKRNERDDAVCEIINLGHYSQIIKSDFYEPYAPEEEVAAEIPAAVTPIELQDAFCFTDAEMFVIDRMNRAGEKHSSIASKISEEFGREVSRQRVTRYINS